MGIGCKGLMVWSKDCGCSTALEKEWTLCMKDRKYDKHHIRSKNHSGCLETLCHVCGPLRNKMATLVVIPSRSDGDPSADPVPGQTVLPTVSLTESGIPRSLFKWMFLKTLWVCQTRSNIHMCATFPRE